MEPIQVYLHEEYDLHITKPKSYFSLLPSDVKKLAYHYFDFFSWEQLDELIERDNPEEFEFQELPIAPFNWRVRAGFDRAIKAKKWNSAVCFLKWGADPNSTCENVIALLHAVRGNSAALVEGLFNAGAQPPKMKLKECWRHALEKSSGKIVRLLIEKGGMKSTYKSYHNSFLYAVRHGNHDGVRVLLAAGAPINRAYSCGWGTPIHEAARNNDIPMARLLLEAGALINLDRYSSVFTAAVHGHTDMVRLLLKCTKQVDPNDSDAVSALAICSKVECVQVLLDAGVDPERNPDIIDSVIFRFDTEVKEWIENAQQKLNVLLAHINKSKPVGPRIDAWVNEGHPFCSQNPQEPKCCHFCEFLPVLQTQFGQ